VGAKRQCPGPRTKVEWKWMDLGGAGVMNGIGKGGGS
jgi:hypothetical protein